MNGTSLEKWLAVATHGLCAEARGRIAEEMFCHVSERARDLQVEGHSPNDAFDEAVRQLGKPKVAARGFRETNLTAKEFTFLAKLAEPKSGTWRTFLFIAAMVLAIFFGEDFIQHVIFGNAGILDDRAFRSTMVLVLPEVPVLALMYILSARAARNNRLRLALLICGASLFQFGLIASIIIGLSMPNFDAFSILCPYVGFVPISISFIRFWLKLGRIAPPKAAGN